MNSLFSYETGENSPIQIIEPPLPSFENARGIILQKLRSLSKKFELMVPVELNSAADELEFYTFVNAKFRKEIDKKNDQFVFALSKVKLGLRKIFK